MTAGEIIDKIEQLPPGEQARVISFGRGLTPTLALGGRELASLADELVKATGRAEVEALRKRIQIGFYGT